MRKLVKFTKLEKSVIDWYWEKHPFLKDQLSEERVISNEFSWSGFFIDFAEYESFPKIQSDLKSPIDWPRIESPEIKTHIDAILFHDNWRIRTIDIHSFEDKIPENIETFSVHDN